MGGIPGGDDPVAAAEDRGPGARHGTKNLGPLFDGVPLEEHVRLGLGGVALLKNPRDAIIVSRRNGKARSVEKHVPTNFRRPTSKQTSEELGDGGGSIPRRPNRSVRAPLVRKSG